jgi:hypothetical protein
VLVGRTPPLHGAPTPTPHPTPAGRGLSSATLYAARECAVPCTVRGCAAARCTPRTPRSLPPLPALQRHNAAARTVVVVMVRGSGVLRKGRKQAYKAGNAAAQSAQRCTRGLQGGALRQGRRVNKGLLHGIVRGALGCQQGVHTLTAGGAAAARADCRTGRAL